MATYVKAQEKNSGLTLQEQRRRQRMITNSISYVVLGIFAIVFVIPLLYTISTSFKEKTFVFDGKFIPNSQTAISPWYWNFFGNTKGDKYINTQSLYSAVITDDSEEMTLLLEEGKFLNTPEVKAFVKELKSNPTDMTYAKELAYDVDIVVKTLDYDGAWFSGRTAGNMPPFAMAYINSVFVSFMITLLQLLTCSLAAYAFARLKWPGRDNVFLTYLGTMMVPGQVTMIPVFILFKTFGIIDTYIALILPAAFSAYGTFMLRQYFMSIPNALEEAAFIDGATRFQILFQIIIPLAKTALSTLAIFVFLYAWNDFMWPLIVINSDSKKTLPIALQGFQSTYGSQYHLIMAASLIVLIPVIVIFIVGQKYITRGIMMTGMK